MLQVKWFNNDKLMKELPECNYTINKDGGELCNMQPNLLNLTEVIESFAGNYSCQGQNVAGWGPVSDQRELVVYCKLIINFMTYLTIQLVYRTVLVRYYSFFTTSGTVVYFQTLETQYFLIN